jgi:pimeloyl-ACP methyl ester carboxylesterase
VILLHGGMGNSRNFGFQVPALVSAGYRAIVIDSRGQGRSTAGRAPLSYALMESDVVAVLDALALPKADVVGWSDGANIGVTMAMRDPARLGRLFAFGPNVNSRYLTPPVASPLFAQVAERLVADYASLGGTPDGFDRMSTLVRAMQAKEPDYSDAELAAIKGPVIAIAGADHDEFISQHHFDYAAAAIPGARRIVLHGVSHFAPWQDPDGFNAAMIGFLDSKD